MPDFGFVQSIIYFLIVITPIVFIHELGHFWVARRSGVAVEVFSIGFGYELLHWIDKTGTRWRVGIFPFGGYVKMRGDENAASMNESSAKHIPNSFASARLFQRMAIVAAGPIANFLLAIILFAFVYIGSGKAFIAPIIGEVIPQSAAEQAKLKADDRVLSVDGRTVRDFNDLRAIIFQNPDTELLFEVSRSNDTLFIAVTPEAVYSADMDITYGQLGARSLAGEYRRLGISEAMLTASIDVFHICSAMLRGIGRLLSGEAQKGEIGGPIRIAELSQNAATQGITALLIFTALISVNLGLINLLPIPALDGGHLCLFIIEAILGKPLPEAWQNMLMRGGIVFLLALMVLVTVFDLMRIVSG